MTVCERILTCSFNCDVSSIIASRDLSIKALEGEKYGKVMLWVRTYCSWNNSLIWDKNSDLVRGNHKVARLNSVRGSKLLSAHKIYKAPFTLYRIRVFFCRNENLSDMVWYKLSAYFVNGAYSSRKKLYFLKCLMHPKGAFTRSQNHAV